MASHDNYHYGLIGNCTSAALVSAEASIDWLCLPFFDSPSLFARILDDEKGGHFQIQGVNTKAITQRYIQDTAILKTIVETAEGCFEIHDYMPRYSLGPGNYYCPSEVHRAIRVLSGQPRLRVDLEPRPNYALGGVVYEFYEEYVKLISTRGGYMSYYLYSNLDLEALVRGEVVTPPPYAFIVLSYHEKLASFTPDRIYHELEKTKAYWLDYVDQIHYPYRYREAVVRSVITLKLLSYQRTGAVLAAPTTSLPEVIGQQRNWDYRYCWMRDGGMTIDVYARVGDFETSAQFMHYIIQRLPLKNDPIHLMYSIDGHQVADEQLLDHLAGYAHSRPVRIGNNAHRQRQNDLYGNLIEAIYTFLRFNHTIKSRERVQVNEEIWTLVRSLVNHIRQVWRQPDSGIWEFRGAERHFTHSKLMSWVGMDRAAKIAAFWRRTRYIDSWRALAEEIKADILRHGWNDQVQAFTMYYGSDALDAASLLMLHYNFLPPDDPRLVSTVQQCYRHLVKNGFMFRYRVADDFGEPENAFIVCTFWLVNALYLIGEKAKARELFEHMLKYRNHVGLLSEDIEVYSGRLTGNFPQAYSHLALIQSAFVLETAYNWLDKDASCNGGEPLR
ncbi:MAG: glycosyl hydrolase [Candidatus Tectimicrobiota bacterium]|nr:MAG: glycosyl hydrolase [Candidatus Tectomicrobia bacterium]